MNEAIIVQRLGKRFFQHHPERPNTIMEAALSGWRKLESVDCFWALRDVSFTVSPGEMLGIIGRNGAGKSTLLQLIGGVGRPEEGMVKLRGRVGALLDLGAGLSADLTGRENVFVCGVVAGLTRREVAKNFNSIVEFAELRQFIENPVRTYSTGMQMRLAFSIAVHTDPNVLLIDEFLSVGDLSFQAKCLERITRLKAEGCAIVYISHSVEQIQELCDQVLWLRQGKVVAHGEPEVVVGQYLAEMHSETQRRTPARPSQMTRSGTLLKLHENRFGSLDIEISDIILSPTDKIRSGDSLSIKIEYQASNVIENPIFNVSITNLEGQVFCDISTDSARVAVPEIHDRGHIYLHIDRLDLSAGRYFVNVGIYEKNWNYAYDYHWHAYPLEIQSTSHLKSILSPPFRWQMEGKNKAPATVSTDFKNIKG